MILEIDFNLLFYLLIEISFYIFWEMTINVLSLKKWTEVLKTVKEAVKKYEVLNHWKNKCHNNCKIGNKFDTAV